MASGVSPAFLPGQSAAFIILGNIGDVLLLEPAIRHLHERGVTIDLYCTAETTMVWQGDPRLRKLIPIRAGNVKYQAGQGVDPLKVERQVYNYIFDFLPTTRSAKVIFRLSAPDRYTWQGNKLSRQLVRAFACNHRLPLPDLFIRRDRFYLTLLGLNGAAADAALPARMTVSEDELARFRQERPFFNKGSGEQLLILQPTARWKRKLWATEKWRSLIGELQKRPGVRVALISGPVPEEQELVQAIASSLVPDEAVFAGTLAWADVKKALALADGFIGLDSAPYHLAAMLNKPLVVLFGEADERNWGPVLPRQISIKAPIVGNEYKPSEIPDTTVLAAIRKVMQWE